jgi:hypothetical protein
MEEVKAKEFGLSLNRQLETLSMPNKELELLFKLLMAIGDKWNKA